MNKQQIRIHDIKIKIKIIFREGSDNVSKLKGLPNFREFYSIIIRLYKLVQNLKTHK